MRHPSSPCAKLRPTLAHTFKLYSNNQRRPSPWQHNASVANPIELHHSVTMPTHTHKLLIHIYCAVQCSWVQCGTTRTSVDLIESVRDLLSTPARARARSKGFFIWFIPVGYITTLIIRETKKVKYIREEIGLATTENNHPTHTTSQLTVCLLWMDTFWVESQGFQGGKEKQKKYWKQSSGERKTRETQREGSEACHLSLTNTQTLDSLQFSIPRVSSCIQKGLGSCLSFSLSLKR